MAIAAAHADHERQQAEARERTAEGQRRIDEFLKRMRDAGNPGCSRYDLTVVGRRQQINRRFADIRIPPHDDDPDELIVYGWVIEDRSYRAQPRDSASERGDWQERRTILSVDGVAYDMPDRGPGGDFGRARVDPANITMEMLVGTLLRNGLEV
jgi:hypothetical protein